jgi:hypothetical protein
VHETARELIRVRGLGSYSRCLKVSTSARATHSHITLQVHGTARASIRVRGPRLNSCCRALHSANQMRDRARSEPCFRAPLSANQMRDRARSEPCFRAPHSANQMRDRARSEPCFTSEPCFRAPLSAQRTVAVQDQNRVSGPRFQLNEPWPCKIRTVFHIRTVFQGPAFSSTNRGRAR